MIDDAGVSIVHGHSSHHPKGIEVYKDRLILYGCGDFLNDYEGIGGYERYRGGLAIMYFVDIEVPSRALAGLDMVPLQIRQFRLVRPSEADVGWLHQTLHFESSKLGTELAVTSQGHFSLQASGRTNSIDACQ